MSTVKEYRDQIDFLENYARELALSLQGCDKDGNPKPEGAPDMEVDWSIRYPLWYAQVYEVIKFLLPDRLKEFESYYLADPKRKAFDLVSFAIQDWLLGRRPRAIGQPDVIEIVTRKFLAQMQLLAACKMKLDSVVMNFKKLTLADLFDSELDSARDLHKNGYLRPAGVIARVVLEKHLTDICLTHNVTVKKKNPDLGDYNDALKRDGVFDIPQWRKIQRLTDITNYCCHNKEREPTKEEVLELIDGAEQTIKSVF